MELTEAIADLHSHIECAVCLETLTAPKLLTCGHRFCKQCLQKVEQGWTICCPLCKSVTKNGVRNLPSDGLAANIKNDLEYIQDIAQNKNCAGCPGVKAITRCFNCQSSLCKECTSRHNKLYEGKNHTVMKMDSSTSLSCLKHGKDLAYICEDCHDVVCSSCLLKDCYGHKFSTVGNALEKYLKIRETAEKKTAFIRENSTTLEARLQINVDETVANIQDHSDKVVSAIQKHTKTLIETLKTLHSDAVHIQNVSKAAGDGLKDFKDIQPEELRRNLPVGLLRKMPAILRPEVQNSYDNYLVEGIKFEPHTDQKLGSVQISLSKPKDNSWDLQHPRIYGSQLIRATRETDTSQAGSGDLSTKVTFTLNPADEGQTVAELFSQ